MSFSFPQISPFGGGPGGGPATFRELMLYEKVLYYLHEDLSEFR